MIAKNTNRKPKLKKQNLGSGQRTCTPKPKHHPLSLSANRSPSVLVAVTVAMAHFDPMMLSSCSSGSAVSRSRTNSARFGAFARRRSGRKSGEGRERTDPPRAYTLSINPRSAVTCCLAISQERRNSHSPNPSNRCRDFVPTIAYYFRK